MPNKSATKKKARATAAMQAKEKAIISVFLLTQALQYLRLHAVKAAEVTKAKKADAEEEILSKLIAITTEEEFAEWSHDELNLAISLLEKKFRETPEFLSNVTKSQLVMFRYVKTQKYHEEKKKKAEALELKKAAEDLFADPIDSDETPDSPAASHTVSPAASSMASVTSVASATSPATSPIDSNGGFTTVRWGGRPANIHSSTSVTELQPEMPANNSVSTLKKKAATLKGTLLEKQREHNRAKYGEHYNPQNDTRKATKQMEVATAIMLGVINSDMGACTIDVTDHDTNTFHNKIWVVTQEYFKDVLNKYVEECIPGYWIDYHLEDEKSDTRSVKIHVETWYA